MKKIVVLAGLAACVYGAVKFFGSREQDEFASTTYNADDFRTDVTYPPSSTTAFGDGTQERAA
jgi:hypothetical protein